MGLHTTLAAILLSLALVNSSPVNLGLVDEVWNAFSMTLQKQVTPEIQTHDAGDTFELHCETQNADMVVWDYPSKNRTNDDRVTIESRDFGEGLQLSVLTVRNATYEDTGSYKCSCGGMSDIDHFMEHQTQWMIASRKVYIFIRDNDRLLFGKPQTHPELLMGVVKEDITIPCKKTDPEANVMLYIGQGVMRFPVTNGNKYQYNNREGFIIKKLRLQDSHVYTCEATKNNRTDNRQYQLRIFTSRPLMYQPNLTVRDNHPVARIGRTLPLKCQVAVGRHQLTHVKWFKTSNGETKEITEESRANTTIDFIPREPLCSQYRLRCSFKSRIPSLNPDLVRVTGRLKLGNIQESDSGSYHCEVTSSQLVKRSETRQITVIEELS